MENLAPHGGQHKPLIRCEVELDLRPSTRAGTGGYRPAIANLALTGDTPARVLVDVEAQLIGGQHEARLVGNPCNDLAKHAPEESLLNLALVLQCEVKVLRKTVGLEVALLEAGAALEHPRRGQRRVHVDAGQQPAEDIVLLHDVGQQAQCGGRLENLALVDHVAAFPQRSGTQSRHAVCRWLEASAGSSRA